MNRTMRILVLVDSFIPEISAPAFRTMDHARHWREAGHDVTVVTGAPNAPRGRLFPGHNNHLYQEEWIDGIHVIRVWTYIAPNAGFVKRTLDQASFMVSAVLQSWRLPEFDIILASSPAFFVAMAGYMISRTWRIPWIFELRDLWPASIEAVGLGSIAPMRMLEKLELFLYHKANRIISVTHSFRENLIKRGISPEKIDIVTNGVDTDKFDPAKADGDIRKSLGIDRDDFLVAYFGTTGMAHGLETMLEAAAICNGNCRAKFLIMGDGAERKTLELKSRKMGNNKIIFKDSVPHQQMPDYFAALDMFLVHLKPHPVFETVIPSKIFEAMSMETPILCALQGEGSRVVKSSGAGICISPGNPIKMADTIIRLSSSPDELRQMGKNGRKAATARYSRLLKATECLRSFEKVLEGQRQLHLVPRPSQPEGR